MQALPTPAERPLTVTLIALFQVSLATYLLYFATLACLDPPNNLGLLRSALRLLIGRTDSRSYAGSPHDEIVVDLFFMVAAALGIAVDSAITGWGLWRLKKWARHSVAGQYGMLLVLWARSFLYFGFYGGFSRVLASRLQPVYIVVFVEALICLTLWLHGGVAEAFGEAE